MVTVRSLKCWIWFDSLDCLDCMQLVLCCNLVMNPVLLNGSFFPYSSSLKWSYFTFLLSFGDVLLLFSLAPSYLFYFLFTSLSLSFWLKRSSCTSFFFFVGSWMCAFNIDAFCPYPSPNFFFTLSQQEISKELGYIEKWLRYFGAQTFCK